MLKLPWPVLKSKPRIRLSNFGGPKEQLAISREQIEAQKKELKKKEEALAQADQSRYNIGVKETEDALKAQVIGVCHRYCLQVWIEALNMARVEPSLDLRKIENIFYPPVLRITTQPAAQAFTTLEAPSTAQLAVKAPVAP